MKRDLLVVVILTGCSTSLDVNNSAVVTCTKDADCPKGWTCVDANRCVDAELIDTSGAQLLVPQNNSVQASANVDFVWAPVKDASTYTLTVATDADFTNVVVTLPQPGTTTRQQLGPGTYYWRVTTDVTRVSEVTEASVFGVYDDAVYVACTDTDCSATDADLGTKARPHHSINVGIRAAAAAGLTNVRVAVRPNGAAYNETLQPLNSVSLQGNYDASFTETSDHALVAAAGPVLSLGNVTDPLSITSFELQNTTSTGDSTVLETFQCGESLVFRDIVMSAPSLRTSLISVDRSIGKGPQFIDATIEGTLAPAAGTAALVTVSDASAVQFQNTQLRGHAGAATALGTHILSGIAANLASISFSGGSITLDGGDGLTAIQGVVNEQVGESIASVSLTVADAVFDVRNAVINAAGISVDYFASIEVDRSSFLVGNSANATAIAYQCPDISFCAVAARHFVLTSNVITVFGSTSGPYLASAIGIDLARGEGTILGNTIAVHQANRFEIGVISTHAYPRVIDNLVLSAGHSCATTRCHTGFFEEDDADPPGGQPLVLLNNAFVAYGADCPYIVGTFASSSCVALTDTRAGEYFTPDASGNVTPADLTSVGLASYVNPGDSLKPTSSAGLVGFDPASTTCEPVEKSENVEADGVAADATVSPCNARVNDRNNVSRPSPPTIGAYEP